MRNSTLILSSILLFAGCNSPSQSTVSSAPDTAAARDAEPQSPFAVCANDVVELARLSLPEFNRGDAGGDEGGSCALPSAIAALQVSIATDNADLGVLHSGIRIEKQAYIGSVGIPDSNYPMVLVKTLADEDGFDIYVVKSRTFTQNGVESCVVQCVSRVTGD